MDISLLVIISQISQLLMLNKATLKRGNVKFTLYINLFQQIPLCLKTMILPENVYHKLKQMIHKILKLLKSKIILTEFMNYILLETNNLLPTITTNSNILKDIAIIDQLIVDYRQLRRNTIDTPS